MRYLFYCVDGTGLCHIVGAYAAATAVARLAPDSRSLVVTDGRFDPRDVSSLVTFHYLRHTNHEVYQRPELLKTTEAELGVVLTRFDPAVLIVDHHLLPTALLASLPASVATVRLLRAEAETPMLRKLDESFPLFDKILIANSEEELSFRYSSRALEVIKGNPNVVITGPIYRRMAARDRARSAVGVFLGGGGPHRNGIGFWHDTELLAELTMDAIEQLRWPALDFQVVCGPNYPNVSYQQLLRRAPSHVTIHRELQDPADVYSKCRFALTLGGISTTTELASLQVPMIVFAKRTMNEAQESRCLWLERAGWAKYVRDWTSNAIRESIEELEQGRAAAMERAYFHTVIPNGDDRAAAVVVGLAGGRDL